MISTLPKLPKIAVNLADLTELPTFISQCLLQDFTTKDSPTVYVDKKVWDEVAIILDGPASQDKERLRFLVEILLTTGSQKLKRPFRIYAQGPRNGWKKFKKEDLDEIFKNT